MVGGKENRAHPLIYPNPLGFPQVGLYGTVTITPPCGFRNDTMINLADARIIAGNIVCDTQCSVSKEMLSHTICKQPSESSIDAAA
jgi:hypothetical protein